MTQNKSYLLAVALWAGVAVAPVMAEEASDFHALSQVATNIAPMTQDQLAATEGGLLDVAGLLGTVNVLAVTVDGLVGTALSTVGGVLVLVVG